MVAPLTPLTATASSGQPSVTVAAGQGANYLAGQVIGLFGGLGTAEQAQGEGGSNGPGGLTVQSVTPGGGSGGGDLITFTGNLTHSYAQVSSTPFSDGFGPYAYAGAYLTPYQPNITSTVAGRSLKGEDQQNGLHLLGCQRFTDLEVHRPEPVGVRHQARHGLRGDVAGHRPVPAGQHHRLRALPRLRPGHQHLGFPVHLGHREHLQRLRLGGDLADLLRTTAPVTANKLLSSYYWVPASAWSTGPA